MTASTRVPGKKGKLPYDVGRVNAYMTAAMFPSLQKDNDVPPPPDTLDNLATVDPAGIPMYLNDRLGCCVEAMKAHGIQIFTGRDGNEITVTDDAVLADYRRIGGYDPDAKPDENGENPTDRGENVQRALEDWVKNGIARPDGTVDKILAFAQIRTGDWAVMQAAMQVFEVIMLGVELPESAEDQFSAGEPWTVVEDSEVVGGHAVLLGEYAKRPDGKLNGRVWTWAHDQEVDADWLAKYTEEMWIVVTEDQWGPDGLSPDKFNQGVFEEEFTRQTGKPFPGVKPVEPPAPVDPPAPPPIPTQVIQGWDSFVIASRHWLQHRHVGYNERFEGELVAFLEANLD